MCVAHQQGKKTPSGFDNADPDFTIIYIQIDTYYMFHSGFQKILCM